MICREFFFIRRFSGFRVSQEAGAFNFNANLYKTHPASRASFNFPAAEFSLLAKKKGLCSQGVQDGKTRRKVEIYVDLLCGHL